MKVFSIGVFVVLLALLALPLQAQSTDTLPRPADVSTLDGIIKAYYEVVSGPAGAARQWARDRSLHHAQALVGVTGKNRQGEPFARMMSLAQYHEASGDTAQQSFFEDEIHRVTQQFGNITHVWSTYAWRRAADGPVEGRGINSIQLYFDGKRWWITSWIFDSERSDNPIPAAFLPTP